MAENGSGPKGDEAHFASRRTHVVKELLKTEHSYVSNLDALYTHVYVPLAAAVAREDGSVARSDLAEVFSQLEVILKAHKLMASKLTQDIENGREGDASISMSFIEICPFLKGGYSEWVNHYPHALKRLMHLRQSEETVGTIIADGELKLKEKTQGLSICDIMIMPVQRIPRYNLLLADLQACTPETHRDAKLLPAACRAIQELLSVLQARSREAEALMRVVEIAESLTPVFPSFDLVQPGRAFIRKGRLGVPGAFGIAPREVILFNDLLLICRFTIPMPEVKLVPLNAIPLDIMQVASPHDDEGDGSNIMVSFNAPSGETVDMTLVAATNIEATQWIEEMTSQQSSVMMAKQTFQSKGVRPEHQCSIGELALQFHSQCSTAASGGAGGAGDPAFDKLLDEIAGPLTVKRARQIDSTIRTVALRTVHNTYVRADDHGYFNFTDTRQGWETFELVTLPDGLCCLITRHGKFVRANDKRGVVNTADVAQAWERFIVSPHPEDPSRYCFQTAHGTFLSARKNAMMPNYLEQTPHCRGWESFWIEDVCGLVTSSSDE